MARSQMKSAAKIRVEVVIIKSPMGLKGNIGIIRADVRRDITKMLAYSAIKIKANPPALYSTLKPETSSDSPSGRSNGVRLVSARSVINHIKVIGSSRVNFGMGEVWGMWVKSNEVAVIRRVIRIRAILTS